MNNKLKILGLDLGGKAGWALYDNGAVTSGTWKLIKTTTKKRNELPGYRFVRFWNNLEQIEKSGEIDYIFFEDVKNHVGIIAAQVYGGYKHVLFLFCDNRYAPIPYAGFGVGTIKKRATGKGNAKKPAMIEAANSKLLKGRKVVDDNEADALWILRLAMEKLNQSWPGEKL
jgi:Holliday junction resolvasome RuvABC endonuclease subunit